VERKSVFYVGALAACLSFAVSAQQAGRSDCEDPNSSKRDAVAVLKSLNGNVLVSDKTGISSAATGQRIANGVRVTTTAKASVTVAFDCGCEVQLSENQRLDVELPRACAALVAGVQPVAVAAALGAPTVAPLTVTPTGLLTVGAIGGGGYALLRRDRNVSPN
jgi:hypothetical protein